MVVRKVDHLIAASLSPFMKRVIAIFFPVLFSLGVFGQLDLEEKTLSFMEDLNAGDSAKIRTYFMDQALIRHVDKDTLVLMSIDDFLGICPEFQSKRFQEDFYKIDVKEFKNGLAYVDVYFRFLIDGEMAFSGVDHVVWIQRGEEMLIESIHSSRLLPTLGFSPQSDNDIQYLTNLVTKWHIDASEGNYDAYFGLMDESFYFLGTDPKERWSKRQFSEFCRPYFDQGRTWTFTPKWRNWYFSDDGNTAWFEEQLDSPHMDEVRGSGVMVRIKGKEWKIVHYNLSVLIENEKMKKFLKLRRK